MEELKIFIEAKIPIFYYGKTFEQEAEYLLKAISRKLDLNLNVVPEIMQIMPAIEREGIENGLLIFYLDEIKERHEVLTKRFLSNSIMENTKPTAPPVNQVIPEANFSNASGYYAVLKCPHCEGHFKPVIL